MGFAWTATAGACQGFARLTLRTGRKGAWERQPFLSATAALLKWSLYWTPSTRSIFRLVATTCSTPKCRRSFAKTLVSIRATARSRWWGQSQPWLGPASAGSRRTRSWTATSTWTARATCAWRSPLTAEPCPRSRSSSSGPPHLEARSSRSACARSSSEQFSCARSSTSSALRGWRRSGRLSGATLFGFPTRSFEWPPGISRTRSAGEGMGACSRGRSAGWLRWPWSDWTNWVMTRRNLWTRWKWSAQYITTIWSASMDIARLEITASWSTSTWRTARSTSFSSAKTDPTCLFWNGGKVLVHGPYVVTLLTWTPKACRSSTDTSDSTYTCGRCMWRRIFSSHLISSTVVTQRDCRQFSSATIGVEMQNVRRHDMRWFLIWCHVFVKLEVPTCTRATYLEKHHPSSFKSSYPSQSILLTKLLLIDTLAYVTEVRLP